MASTNNQNYFSTISKRQIEEKLLYLKRELPRKPTKRNFQISKKLLEVNRLGINEKNLQSNLQEVANMMRFHLQIERPIKIITIYNVEAGKFERIDNLNCIYINGNLTTQTYEQKIAILAHEMSHYYLIYKHNIYLKNTNENELLTELNAIYVGFGLLLLKGYRTLEKKEGNIIQQSKVGYIGLNTIREGIIKTAYMRKQNPIWILKNIGIFNIPFFAYKLYDLLKDYYHSKKTRYKKR